MLPQVGRRQVAVFGVEGTADLGPSAVLTVTLADKSRYGDPHNLGRFRLSVSGDPQALEFARRRFAVGAPQGRWTRLAAVYALLGRTQQAIELFDRLLDEAADAAAHAEIVQHILPWENVHRGLLARRPQDAHLHLAYGRRLAQQARWEEAAAAFRRVARLDPETPPWIATAWWTIGPYADDLGLSCPPETHTDPLQPVPPPEGDEGEPPRAWRSTVADAQGWLDPPEAIRLAWAEGSFRYGASTVRLALDGDRETFWSAFLRQQQPLFAVLKPEGGIRFSENARLRFELDFQGPSGARHALGRFRLWASGERKLMFPYSVRRRHLASSWFVMAHALALARQGNFAAAEEQAAKVLTGEYATWSLPTAARLIVSIAQAKQGRLEPARQALEQATQRLEEAAASFPIAGASWHDALICEILRREAEAVLAEAEKQAER